MAETKMPSARNPGRIIREDPEALASFLVGLVVLEPGALERMARSLADEAGAADIAREMLAWGAEET